MRRFKALAMLALAAAPVARGAAVTGYDSMVYPLISGTLPINAGQVTAGQAVGSSQISAGVYNALTWSPSSVNAPVSLTPTGFSSSTAIGTDGANQVGSGTGFATTGLTHALLWSSTASSYADLNPTALPGINNSSAVSVSGNQEFGSGFNSSTSNLHPILWTGTAGSAIDLTPTNLASTFVSCNAEQTDGVNQVGSGNVSGRFSTNGWHALLWSSSAGSAVDLTPTNYPTLVNSFAMGVGGNQQVGLAYAQIPSDPFTGPYNQAILWTGTGASALLLNPSSGFTQYGCEALGTNGSQQVGVGLTTAAYTGQALLWSNTAASVVNLHDDLPTTGSWNFSSAGTLNSAGTASGTAIGKLNGITATYAASWIPNTTTSAIVLYGSDTYQFAANATAGISNRSIGGLNIANGAYAILPTATTSQTRQLLIVNGSGLVLAGTTGNWTGSLNVANNDLDLPGASLATVTNQLKQGYANGTWNGGGGNGAGGNNTGQNNTGGITSTVAAADTAHLTALGVLQNNQSGTALFNAAHLFDGNTPGVSDVLVKFTYYGDSNLDGKVDGSDYSNIDNGRLNNLTGWSNGDFNFDGVVNGSDYTLIDNAFNSQGGQLQAEIAGPTTQAFSVNQSVPEPAMGFPVGVFAAAMLRRRRDAYE